MPTPVPTLALIPPFAPLALLLPAIQAAREAGRTAPTTTLKQIELAVHIATSN